MKPSITFVISFFFLRTRMSVYFINKVTVIDRQARDHLAQAQRKNEEEENETRMAIRDHKLERPT
jgi:hypothetical protein